MKKRILSLLSVLGLVGGAAQALAETATVKIKGMTCGACVRTVKSQLSSIPGIDMEKTEVKVGEAKIALKPGLKSDTAAIKGAVEKAGFVVEDVKLSN